MEPTVLVVLLLALMVPGSFSTTFTFTNKCSYPVWPAALSNAGKPQFPSTGFRLANGASQSLAAPAGWAGRFWARTGCTDNNGRLTCATGDCGSGQLECNGAGGAPPTTLAEFTLNGDGGKDFYDVSLVDGFSLPLSVVPQGGSGCGSTACAANVNEVCPPQLSVKGSDGSTIGCKSACLALNEPQYCCTGEFNTAETCPPTDYSRIFKNACPQAYSYAFDDKTSTITCPTGVNYDISFCP